LRPELAWHRYKQAREELGTWAGRDESGRASLAWGGSTKVGASSVAIAVDEFGTRA